MMKPSEKRRLHAPHERAPTLREATLVAVLLAAAAVAVSFFDQSSSPCGIPRIPAEDALAWRRPPAQPRILTPFYENAAFASRTSRAALLEEYGSARVKLTSSNSFSEGEADWTLAEYLEAGSVPGAAANESYYLFGPALDEKLEALVADYVFPKCGGAWCAPENLAASFGVGGENSGVSFHTHGSGFGETLHGRKRWLLYPPGAAPPGHHPDVSTRRWVEAVLPALSRRPAHDCVLGAGELLYFPPNWWHATLNLDAHTVFVSSFASDHARDGERLWAPG
mmetsp:Transcript_26948/g.80797  ORF Transcript_26948/g.80797 Transcript_26948/m.80797 type:complete len:281 (+) Transcript_26948:348-1190(+)